MASACTGSVDISFGGKTPAEAAVELIEGDTMAEQLGVGPIADAVCQAPLNQDVGTVFTCTAQSEGQTMNFDVVLEEDDRIFAGPTNVIDSAALPLLETAAAQELKSQNGFALTEDAMDCGDSSVILDANQQMPCALTNPDNGVVFDAVVTVTDTETGTFDVEIVGEAS